MNRSFYKQIVDSFHLNEKKDFEAICSILDKKVYEKSNIVVISDDPYLLVLIFICLIRHEGINIHILNSKEGLSEIERLVAIINPDLVISTNKDLFQIKNSNHVWLWKSIWIDGAVISSQPRYDVGYKDREFDFTIITYSPYPTKINKIEANMFDVMLNSLAKDFDKYDLLDDHDYGCIPFASNNSDYLLYMVALRANSPNMTLGSEQDVWVTEHSHAKTLFIPKKEFCELYEAKISSIFEKPFMFRLHLNYIWAGSTIVNLLIKRRLKRLFKGFKNVVVIGILENMYMIELLSNLSFVKFYSIFTMSSALQFGTINKSLDMVIPESNEVRSDRFVPYHQNYFHLTYSLFTEDRDVYNLNNNQLIYVKHTYHEANQNKYKYEIIGNNKNMFINKGSFIYPESLEKVINSNPLIRRSVILTFNKRIILVIEPNMDILDSIRINQGMFHDIIQQQIDALNNKLPEEYQINGFMVGTSFIESNRLGDINRVPFNTINKM